MAPCLASQVQLLKGIISRGGGLLACQGLALLGEIVDRNGQTIFKCLADKFSYFVQLARPADDIQIWTSLADCLGCSLCHAADYADDPGPAEASLVIVEMAKPAEDLFLGMLAHRAGVDQGDLGVAELVYQGKALGLELVGNQLGIKFVHLAAGGFDVNGSCHFVYFTPWVWSFKLYRQVSLLQLYRFRRL